MTNKKKPKPPDEPDAAPPTPAGRQRLLSAEFVNRFMVTPSGYVPLSRRRSKADEQK